MEMIRDTEEALNWHLHDLRVAIEMGFCRSVRSGIKLWGASLETAETPEHRAEYAKILAEADAMFEVENVHGPGSLLNLDHPYVVSLGKQPRPVFLVSEIEAAKKYRTFTSRESCR